MKKIYKIIASISVFLIVLFVGVVLVVGNTNKKANAGVIIESASVWQIYSNNAGGTYNNYNEVDNKFQLGIYYSRLNVYGGYSIMSLPYFDGTTNRSMDIIVENITLGYPARLYVNYRPYYNGTRQSTKNTSCAVEYAEPQGTQDAFIVLSFKQIIDAINNDFQTNNNGEGEVIFPMSFPSSANFASKQLIKTSSNTIKQIDNIFDVENKCFTLLYLSDISGLSTTQQRDEITINWGYIDQNDNTIYAEYSPTIKAQNLAVDDDTIIRLVVPLNNNGSTMDYYDISQKALLSTIDSSQGGAIATAHIYGVYLWKNENMIEWGLAEFDTTSTPTSGASMNYLTSTTRLYQYQNMQTSTMTCRLSVSNNFNFITIKNQEQVDVSSVNAVIRQGGFMPAWSLYNWARGSHSGFTSGEQYVSAQYQPGSNGYNAIYQAGRQAGLNENIGTQNWFMNIFQGVDSFLNIRIFPNITFGVLLGIPFIISVVWFIIRSFRGGGGS